MTAIKSIVEGMGCASGVACSAFGILAASQHYSLTVSPLATMVAGYISMGVFFIVGIPIAIWLYQQYHISLEKNNVLTSRREDELIENILSYFFFCKNQSKFLLSHTLRKQIISSLGCQDPVLHPFILELIKDDIILEAVIRASALNDLDKIKLEVKQRLEVKYYQQNDFSLTRSSLIMPGFLGFVTGFGCIAGSGAGLGNLFTVTGYFVGYAAVPGFAIIVLLSAVVMGVTIANTYIDIVKQNEAASLKITCYETLSAKLNAIKNRLMCIMPLKSPPKKILRSQSVDLSHIRRPFFGSNGAVGPTENDAKLECKRGNPSPSSLAFQ